MSPEAKEDKPWQWNRMTTSTGCARQPRARQPRGTQNTIESIVTSWKQWNQTQMKTSLETVRQQVQDVRGSRAEHKILLNLLSNTSITLSILPFLSWKTPGSPQLEAFESRPGRHDCSQGHRAHHHLPTIRGFMRSDHASNHFNKLRTKHRKRLLYTMCGCGFIPTFCWIQYWLSLLQSGAWKYVASCYPLATKDPPCLG